MEIKFAYNQNGETIEKEFEDYLDLVEFVALKSIKDEDFVSMKLGDEEITGGINGLALYALRKVDQVREARKALEDSVEDFEDEEDTDYGEDGWACNECQIPESEESRPENLEDAINDFTDFLNSHTGEEFI